MRKNAFALMIVASFAAACSETRGPLEPELPVNIANPYDPGPPPVATPTGPREGMAIDWRVAPGCGYTIAVPEPTPHALGSTFRIVSPTAIFAVWTLPNYTIHADLRFNEDAQRWQVCSWDRADF